MQLFFSRGFAPLRPWALVYTATSCHSPVSHAAPRWRRSARSAHAGGGAGCSLPRALVLCRTAHAFGEARCWPRRRPRLQRRRLPLLALLQELLCFLLLCVRFLLQQLGTLLHRALRLRADALATLTKPRPAVAETQSLLARFASHQSCRCQTNIRRARRSIPNGGLGCSARSTRGFSHRTRLVELLQHLQRAAQCRLLGTCA